MKVMQQKRLIYKLIFLFDILVHLITLEKQKMINVNGCTVLIVLIQISTYSAASLRLKNVLELPCDQAIPVCTPMFIIHYRQDMETT